MSEIRTADRGDNIVLACSFVIKPLLIDPQLTQNSSPDPADPADPLDQVSGAAARDLPSTRAGGQDDVSSKQTPSN